MAGQSPPPRDRLRPPWAVSQEDQTFIIKDADGQSIARVDFDEDAGWQQHTPDFMRNAEGHWWVALAVALIPIPIGWLLGWLLISTGRWIRGGFGNH